MSVQHHDRHALGLFVVATSHPLLATTSRISGTAANPFGRGYVWPKEIQELNGIQYLWVLVSGFWDLHSYIAFTSEKPGKRKNET
jgi:hypothetical protein